MGKVEEVARAVCIACGHEPETYAYDPALRGQCQKVARAAIEAMRNPTEAMLGAMNETTIEAWDGDAFWPAKDDCKSLFNAAIDAALSEDKEQG